MPNDEQNHHAAEPHETVVTALPINWTYREDNLMIKTHIALFAQNENRVLASATPENAPTEAKQPLSLYEKTLLKAWKASLLEDKKIIEFFDFHVHDSVAGFRTTGAGYVDNSRAARPRDVFDGRGLWQ